MNNFEVSSTFYSCISYSVLSIVFVYVSSMLGERRIGFHLSLEQPTLGSNFFSIEGDPHYDLKCLYMCR